MVLVDTSTWIEHLRRGDSKLGDLLEHGLAATHPFVIGELALGSIAKRDEVLSHLDRLPRLSPVSHDELLHFIESRDLSGSGIGLVDAHLLAAATVASTGLMTGDRTLARAAAAVGVPLY
jgi:predicted nucleic acid-binding protein